MSSMNIGGRSVLLTGATGGLGSAIAHELARCGATLTITGRRSEVLQELADSLGSRVEKVLTVDLARPQELEQLITECANVDIVVANAALPASGELATFSLEQIDRALTVNLYAPMRLTQAFAPKMAAGGGGHIVHIASLAGKTATARASVYNATKFGLRGFALAMRAELATAKVGVSLVTPGFISDAGMFAETQVELPPGFGTKSPQDVADAVRKAIEENKAEVVVAPLATRAMIEISNLAPDLTATIARRLGGNRIATQVAERQQTKR